MNAHNDVKKPSDQSLDARLVLAAAQLRFAARVDFLVARWLERCATNAEVAQRWFKTDRKPTREFGMGVSQTSEFVQVFGCRLDEAIDALRRPASEKRQGTKSREVGHRRCRGRYGDLTAVRDLSVG
jgi:hypothetical protein